MTEFLTDDRATDCADAATAHATASVSAPTAPFTRHPYEAFTWMAEEWDIAKLWSDYDTGKLKPKMMTLDREFIEGFATQVLCLKKDVADDAQGHSFMMRVSVPAARALPTAAFSSPLVLLQPKKGRGILRFDDSTEAPTHILADGNHRIAKAFLEDHPSLEAMMLSPAQSRKYRLP